MKEQLLSGQDLRSSVKGRSEAASSQIGAYQLLADAEVHYLEEPLLGDQDVGRLKVAMDNSLGVQVLETNDDAGQEKAGNFLSKFLLDAQVKAKVSSVAVISDKIEMFAVLKGRVYIDHKRMMEFH